MYKIKKMTSLCCALVFVFSLIINCAYAIESNTSTTYFSKEIVDNQLLYERAVDGISDTTPNAVTSEILHNITATYGTGNDKRVVGSAGISTTQLLSQISTRGSDMVRSDYVTTYFSDFIINEDSNGTLSISPRSNYTKEDSQEDKNNTVRLTVKIYYTTGDIPQGTTALIPYVCFTSYEATWTVLSSSVAATDRALRGEYSGWSLDRGTISDVDSGWKTTTDDSLRMNWVTPEKIEDGAILYFMIATAKCHISDVRGSQWDLEVKCIETQGI